MRFSRLVKGGAVAVSAMAVFLVAGTAGAVNTNVPIPVADKCFAGKVKCVIKKKSCLLNCHSKAAAKGLPVDQVCLGKCHDKFDGGAKGVAASCFGKLEVKNVCITNGDLSALECKVDSFVADVVDALDIDAPSALSKCVGGKIKCVSKYDACLLGQFAKGIKTGAVDTIKGVPKCQAILLGKRVCVGGTNAKAACSNDGQCPGGACEFAKSPVCIGGTNAKAPCTNDGECPGGTCPDLGCFGKLEKKGGCETTHDAGVHLTRDDAFIDDVVAELLAGQNDMNSQRCTGNTSVTCTNAPGGTGGPCTGLGTCEFWFGSNLPLSAGGVATCVSNQWNGAISGTANQGTGASAGTAAVISRVYTGITTNNPCPRCLGDDFPNDGVQDGTCNGGTRNNLACDVNGRSPNSDFGDTSMDCPPTSGALIATLPIDLTNSNSPTGVALTLSAASPNCRALGFTTKKCPCDVCSNDATKPCKTDVDCPGGTCGNPATSTPTAPNSCADGNCDTDLGNGEGECSAGPVDLNCAIQTQRGCSIATQATDCPLPGDFCKVALRKCYANFNGNIGESIVAQGDHAPSVRNPDGVGGWARTTFGTVFCIAPTGSSAVNNVAGLPGPGRLELTGIATDDGADPACPDTFTFTGTSPDGVLDTGWTGIASDSTVISQGKVTVDATCAGTGPNCTCTYTGPIPNANAN